MDIPKLPTTSYVILGLLTLREMSGYDLKWCMDRSFRHFYWAPVKSQIYAELRRLESHGLVNMREVLQQHRPDKRIYSLTQAGRDAMQHWLVEAKVKQDRYKSPFALKLFYGYLLPRERLFALLGNRRRQIMEDIIIMEEKQEDLESKIHKEPDLLFPLLVLERSLATSYAELAWADKALQRLEEWQPSDGA